MQGHFESAADLIGCIRYTSSKLLFDAMVISQLYKNIIKIGQLKEQNNKSEELKKKALRINENI